MWVLAMFCNCYPRDGHELRTEAEGLVAMTAIESTRTPAQVNDRLALLDGGTRPRRDFPVWHFAMVNDHARNRAIERSIAALDLRGKTVVEIGSGTDLIALLFAKHGAAHVVGCEMNANLAGAAQQIISNTPYADRITIIDGTSGAAIERGLLPHAPDVIFTETLDCGVLGEGFLAIANDIHRIAGRQTIVMPGAVRQFAAVSSHPAGRCATVRGGVESPSLANLNRAGDACGFDLRPLNSYATGSYFPVRTELHQYRFLSESKQVRTYQYVDCPGPGTISIRVTGAGTIHGLLSWFSPDFGAASVSNEPLSGSHWHQAYHPLPEDIPVDAGDSISILIDDGGFGWAARSG